MEITASAVNQLRQKTGAGLMDCKKALTEAAGDFEAAIDLLRKKGQKVAELRAARESKEGVVIAITSIDGKSGIALNLGCETDFVGKNEEFVGFAKAAAELALINNTKTLDDLLALPYENGTISSKLVDFVGKIGENISIKKFERIEGAQVVAYIHTGYKVGVLVSYSLSNEALFSTGKDIAMQIAAMSPVAVDKDDVPQAIIDRELDIAREQIKAEGKPENMLDKIAAGKLQKFFKENTLLNQQFVKDGDKTVADILKAIDPNLKVNSFVRMSLS
ncbi:MAG TPA: elongation factor Ts [Bacteroidetes bacterium]|nr:elongation factor Ts [Bacteroidota bacterium]